MLKHHRHGRYHQSAVFLFFASGPQADTLSPGRADPDRPVLSAIVTKPLAFNEIRDRLQQFVVEWRDDTSERAEAQTFWNELLACFGVQRRRVAVFEQRAKRASTGGAGRIDVFWPKVVIGEHKSAGEMKADSAEIQAEDYLAGGDISPEEFPRYIVTSDFQTFRVTDLELPADDRTVTFSVDELPDHVHHLAFLAGYEVRRFSTVDEQEASVEAAELMAALYVALTGDDDSTSLLQDQDDEARHILTASIFLTRVLFLLYGDDAGLWERGLFDDFLRNRTAEDGSDLGPLLAALFQILDTAEDRRPSRADALMLQFPHVNGELFGGGGDILYFNSLMRTALLKASTFDWTRISPAVFGSLFQAIKSKEQRRAGGEHYTSEENILKVIEPLFLDDLRDQLAKANTRRKLRDLHDQIGRLRYLDPACGCGNFLVVAYREMRRLELELLVKLRGLEGTDASLSLYADYDLKVRLDQFAGIEVNWWPAKIAEVAMFLVDHQANREMALTLGLAPNRLPLKITAKIVHANALTLDWATVIPPSDDLRIFGNPPFLGHDSRTEEQAAELRQVWGRDDIGRLDYVTAWYAKTLRYLGRHHALWAFVSTNSIVQGEPAPTLFGAVFAAGGWRIKFAHRTFQWKSEASNPAGVQCVIVGFTRQEGPAQLFEYAHPKASAHALTAEVINEYLVDAPPVLIEQRQQPLSPSVPPVTMGSMPRDNGKLIVEIADYPLVAADPVAMKYLRPLRGSRELLHQKERWCLWMVDLEPADVQRSPLLAYRIDQVRQFRSKSTAKSTRDFAATPHLFAQRSQPTNRYLAIPKVFSERRPYFTADWLPADTIASDLLYKAEDPDGYLFGIISSSMFLTWQKTIGGALESRPRFANTITWNNFPLPLVDLKQRNAIIAGGQGVLSARSLHPEKSLAQHYEPLAMTPELVAAHRQLDRSVDRIFGARGTLGDRERQALLFNHYVQLVSGATLIPPKTTGRTRASGRSRGPRATQ